MSLKKRLSPCPHCAWHQVGLRGSGHLEQDEQGAVCLAEGTVPGQAHG